MPAPPGKTMYKIEKTAGGFTLTFGGLMNKAEHERWVEESERALAGCTKPFGVIVDLRTLKPLSPDAQAVLVQGQGLYKRAGMERSVVILNSPLMTMCRQSGSLRGQVSMHLSATSTPPTIRTGKNTPWLG
jgi:hypothetical protein